MNFPSNLCSHIHSLQIEQTKNCPSNLKRGENNFSLFDKITTSVHIFQSTHQLQNKYFLFFINFSEVHNNFKFKYHKGQYNSICETGFIETQGKSVVIYI